MGLKETITSSLGKKVLEWIPTKDVFLEAAYRRMGKSGKNALSGELKREASMPLVYSLEDWRTAITAATDPENPDRTELVKIYQSCELDDHLMTVIENRILKLKGHSFKLENKDGDSDEDAKKLLERIWFFDLIEIAMWSKFTGTKVIEMAKLNEKGELAEVSAIPDSHINPFKKLIIKDQFDREKGWNYDKPPYSNYYLQVGKDNELGMLEKLAVAVLFKKKAAGSWLDFMEKYGVPPRWVITDREDDDRFDELYDMMKEMVGNHFAVLRGKEKIEIMPSPGTDAHNVFDRFLDRMDAGITKRVAGATGTVDEKAFVGAAQVHQDTFMDRHASDKFFIQYLINEFVIPMLIKISSVYAPLEGLVFKWDESEEMTTEATVEVVTKLAEQFNLDIEEVTRKTGFTIVSQKEQSTAPEEGGTKKKSPGVKD